MAKERTPSNAMCDEHKIVDGDNEFIKENIKWRLESYMIKIRRH